MNNIQANILKGTNTEEFQVNLEVMNSILNEMRQEVKEYEAIHGEYEPIKVEPWEIAQILKA